MYCRIFLLFVLSSTVAAQSEPMVTIVPSSVTPDRPFMLEVSGDLVPECGLGDVARASIEGVADNQQFVIEFKADSSCLDGAATSSKVAYGPFVLPDLGGADEVPVDVRVQLGEQPITQFASTTLRVASPDAGNGYIMPGMYWDPTLPGHGASIEYHNGRVFVALFSYGTTGEAIWRTLQGPLEDGFIRRELDAFRGGTCLLCQSTSPSTALPDFQDVRLASFQRIGSGAAVVAFGDTPGRAMRLRRFSQFNISLDIATIPDLTGTWVFAGKNSSQELPLGPVQFEVESVSQRTVAYVAADSSVAVTCESLGVQSFACFLVDGEETIAEFSAASIAHDRIENEGVIGMKIR